MAINSYYIVVDTGNVRQCIVQCDSPWSFEDWQEVVMGSLEEKGHYIAKVQVPDGTPRETIVVVKGVCTIALLKREDIERAQRMAQMAQGGIIGMG